MRLMNITQKPQKLNGDGNKNEMGNEKGNGNKINKIKVIDHQNLKGYNQTMAKSTAKDDSKGIDRRTKEYRREFNNAVELEVRSRLQEYLTGAGVGTSELALRVLYMMPPEFVRRYAEVAENALDFTKSETGTSRGDYGVGVIEWLDLDERPEAEGGDTLGAEEYGQLVIKDDGSGAGRTQEKIQVKQRVGSSPMRIKDVKGWRIDTVWVDQGLPSRGVNKDGREKGEMGRVIEDEKINDLLDAILEEWEGQEMRDTQRECGDYDLCYDEDGYLKEEILDRELNRVLRKGGARLEYGIKGISNAGAVKEKRRILRVVGREAVGVMLDQYKGKMPGAGAGGGGKRWKNNPGGVWMKPGGEPWFEAKKQMDAILVDWAQGRMPLRAGSSKAARRRENARLRRAEGVLNEGMLSHGMSEENHGMSEKADRYIEEVWTNSEVRKLKCSGPVGCGKLMPVTSLRCPFHEEGE